MKDKALKNKINIQDMLLSASQYWSSEAPEPDSALHEDLLKLFKYKQALVINGAFIWLKENYRYKNFPRIFNWKEALEKAVSKVTHNPHLLAYTAKKAEEDLENLIINLELSSQWHDIKSKMQHCFANETLAKFFDNIKPIKLTNDYIFLCKNDFEMNWISSEFGNRLKELFKNRRILLVVKTKNKQTGTEFANYQILSKEVIYGNFPFRDIIKYFNLGGGLNLLD